VELIELLMDLEVTMVLSATGLGLQITVSLILQMEVVKILGGELE